MTLCDSVCEIGFAIADPIEGLADDGVAGEDVVPGVPLAECEEPKMADAMLPNTLI